MAFRQESGELLWVRNRPALELVEKGGELRRDTLESGIQEMYLCCDGYILLGSTGECSRRKHMYYLFRQTLGYVCCESPEGADEKHLDECHGARHALLEAQQIYLCFLVISLDTIVSTGAW